MDRDMGSVELLLRELDHLAIAVPLVLQELLAQMEEAMKQNLESSLRLAVSPEHRCGGALRLALVSTTALRDVVGSISIRVDHYRRLR